MKEIPGFEGLYACNKEGKIFSLARTIKKYSQNGNIVFYNKTFKERTLSLRPHGYFIVSLRKDNKSSTHLVHRLIGKTFLNLKDDEEINHIDGNKQNNNIKNLETCSRSHNIKHAFSIGLKDHKKSKHPLFFIDEKIEKEVLRLLSLKISQVKIAKQLNMCQASVSEIKLKNQR